MVSLRSVPPPSGVRRGACTSTHPLLGWWPPPTVVATGWWHLMGGVFAFGDAKFYGSLGGVHLAAPIVGMAVTPDGGGYWLVGADGGVFTFGDAPFNGSMGGQHLDAPVVGIAGFYAQYPWYPPEYPKYGEGYWLVASDGGIFTFADPDPNPDPSYSAIPPFYGSLGGVHLAAPIVGMASTSSYGGYWLVGADGGIFSFGDAGFYGSMGGVPLNAPIVGISPTADGAGYRLFASDGGVFSFGDAGFFGSMGGKQLNAPMVAGATTS